MEKLLVKKGYEDRINSIISAIEKATNGTFIGDMAMTTLLGVVRQYDENGNDITVDPNTTTSQITLGDKTYKLKTGKYKCLISELDEEGYAWNIAKIDFMPEHIKDYWENKIV